MTFSTGTDFITLGAKKQCNIFISSVSSTLREKMALRHEGLT